MIKKIWKKLLFPFLSILLMACGIILIPEDMDISDTEPIEDDFTSVIEGEMYDTPYEVAMYIELYGELPENYLTKNEARDLGWIAKEGNLWDVAPGMSIGGDYFGNFEELLPETDDRDYYEADIEYEGGRRNAKRLVFSNDGLYFYTDDHYESFDEIKVGESE